MQDGSRNLVEGIMRISVNYLKFGPVVHEIAFKDFSVLALADIFFSGAEGFVPVWLRPL